MPSTNKTYSKATHGPPLIHTDRFLRFVWQEENSVTILITLLGRKAAKLVVVCKPMSNNVYYSYKSKENRDRQNRLILDQRLLPFDQPAIFSLWAASIWIANLPLDPPLAKCRHLARSLPYCLRFCCTGWTIIEVFSIPHFPMVSSSIGVSGARPVL